MLLNICSSPSVRGLWLYADMLNIRFLVFKREGKTQFCSWRFKTSFSQSFEEARMPEHLGNCRWSPPFSAFPWATSWDCGFHHFWKQQLTEYPDDLLCDSVKVTTSPIWWKHFLKEDRVGGVKRTAPTSPSKIVPWQSLTEIGCCSHSSFFPRSY